MIRFLLTRGHRYTLHAVKQSRGRPALGMVNYEDIVHAQRLRPATYVFTDMDRLAYWDLELAAQLYLRLKNAGFPVLNNPARVKKRYALLRALHEAGLNDFNVHRAEELPAGARFPVFLRKEQGHGNPLGGLLHTRDEALAAMDRAVAGGVPSGEMIFIEYAGEPVREGQYRKLAAFRIGREIVPHYSVNDSHWLVKHGRKDASIEDLYLEEQKMLEENPYAAHLQKVFDIAQIEYGRADFGFLKGRIQVFEINTNPNLSPPHQHPSVTRLQNVRVAWEKYLAALHSIDSPAGPPVWFRRQELEPGVEEVIGHDATEQSSRRWRTREMKREFDSHVRQIGNLQRAKYAIGSTIDFSTAGDGDLYARKGWSMPEPWGTWTLGGEAVLKLHFKNPPPHDLCLAAMVKAFVHPSQPAVRADILVNGEKFARWEVADAAFKKLRLEIPVEKLRSGECELAFNILNPRSPKDLGLSKDTRPLGLGFASLKLEWNQRWRRLASFWYKS